MTKEKEAKSAPKKKKSSAAKKQKKPAKKIKAKKSGPALARLAGPSTYMTNRQARWYIIDLNGKVLGRIATEIAKILRGKNRPDFQPSQDTGDFVIALNASKIQLTGTKWESKKYYTHSGYLGHLRTKSARELHQKFPARMIELAVKGMLPPTNLGKHQLGKLFVYADDKHPHAAQKPEPMTI